MFGTATNVHTAASNFYPYSCCQIMGDSNVIKYLPDLKKSSSTVFIHAPYTISPSGGVNKSKYDSLSNFSVKLITDQLLLSSSLQSATILHPGSSFDFELGLNTCVKNCCSAINKVKSKRNPLLLIENMSGKGKVLCSEIYELDYIIKEIKNNGLNDHIGVCIDTCHAHAAGYDLSTDENVSDFISNLKSIENDIVLVHLNDSKDKLGSKLDNHEDLLAGNAFSKRSLKTLISYFHSISSHIILETPTDININIVGNIYSS